MTGVGGDRMDAARFEALHAAVAYVAAARGGRELTSAEADRGAAGVLVAASQFEEWLTRPLPEARLKGEWPVEPLPALRTGDPGE